MQIKSFGSCIVNKYNCFKLSDAYPWITHKYQIWASVISSNKINHWALNYNLLHWPIISVIFVDSYSKYWRSWNELGSHFRKRRKKGSKGKLDLIQVYSDEDLVFLMHFPPYSYSWNLHGISEMPSWFWKQIHHAIQLTFKFSSSQFVSKYWSCKFHFCFQSKTLGILFKQSQKMKL